jgi:hypothetical protein
MIHCCVKDLEAVVWWRATQVQLEPTSARAAFASGIAPGISKYTGVVQAAKLIVREEGIRVCEGLAFRFFL